jgi:disulfide bond formation protein DsbB
MNTQTVTLFFALLAVTLQALVFTCGVGSVSSGWRSGLIHNIGPFGTVGATIVASFSMLGSLYLSEVAHFLPCKLCWYQRIAMYPIAILLVVGLIRRDPGSRVYAKTLATIGAVISSYHILIERFPNLESSTCDPNNPCSLKWVEKFGYVTIPVMALTAFVTVFLLLQMQGVYDRAISTPRISTPPISTPPISTEPPMSTSTTGV